MGRDWKQPDENQILRQSFTRHSLVAFDDLGLCYGMGLRPGNTFSSTGAPQMIDQIFSRVKSPTKKKYFRADSAFCSEEVIRACLNHKAVFTLTAHGNMLWEDAVARGEVKEWKAWEYTEEEKEVSEKSKMSLPQIELGSYQYAPGWAPDIRFQVVVKRTWVDRPTSTSQQPGWKYYAVITNWNLFYGEQQKVMAFHQKRGNAENFIREGKYGYDLKHFPCKKMNANHAYGLFALLVHNFIRTLALLDNPSNPHYSKKIRRKYVFIPCRVVRSARYVVVKIPNRYKKEVDRLLHAWAERFTPVLKKAG
jgi:Transposase DDE domain group 1